MTMVGGGNRRTVLILSSALLLMLILLVEASAGEGQGQGRIYKNISPEAERRNLLANGLADTPPMGFVLSPSS